MGVYGCLYHIDFKILEAKIIPAFKSGDLSGFYKLKNKWNQSVFEDRDLVIKNAGYLSDNFRDLSEKFNFKDDLRDKENNVHEYYSYATLFETIASTCIQNGNEFFFGKSFLENVFDELTENSVAMEIIEELNGPCFWTHNSGGYYEGIRSWIDPDTTNLLLYDFDKLKLAEDTNFETDYIDKLRGFVKNAVNNGFGIINGGDINIPNQ